jgi:hypothetical protein
MLATLLTSPGVPVEAPAILPDLDRRSPEIPVSERATAIPVLPETPPPRA